ncbi:hypothetical protein BV898_16358 [Hypsibius exemplaris]|uniref:Uncharacterized protein n=1 Tax=Hypsibius exemplaris TaxID=2072580 RepID=A0A9X6ND34_HYPEX|nr:hypothetical protein BV898_16358 [Hypsibius exemplaris]
MHYARIELNCISGEEPQPAPPANSVPLRLPTPFRSAVLPYSHSRISDHQLTREEMADNFYKEIHDQRHSHKDEQNTRAQEKQNMHDGKGEAADLNASDGVGGEQHHKTDEKHHKTNEQKKHEKREENEANRHEHHNESIHSKNHK